MIKNDYFFQGSLFSILGLLLIGFLCISSTENQTKDTPNEGTKVVLVNKIFDASIKANDLDKAEAYITSATEALGSNDKIGYADLCLHKGLLFFEKYDYKNSIAQFLEMQKTALSLNDTKRISVAKHHIGKILYSQKDYVDAEKYFNESLAISGKIKNTYQAIETHIGLGNLFLAKKLYGKAKQHFKRAFDLQVQASELEGAADMATKLGKIVFDLDDFEGALVYFNTSRDIYNSSNNLEKKANNLWDISKVYQAQDNPKLALRANKEALQIWESLEDKMGIATTYVNLANNYFKVGDNKRTERNLDKAGETISSESHNMLAHEIFKGIAVGYEKLGKFQKAYQYHVHYDKSKAVAFNKEKAQTIHELKTKYNSQFTVSEQEQTIAGLRLQQTAESRIRKFLLALIGLGGLLGFNMWRGYNRKKKDNRVLNAQNVEIQSQKMEIDKQNGLLEEKNVALNGLNGKLLSEISERESIEKSSFARDQFLAGMSHEMRTPMNAIVGISHNLLNNEPKKDQVDQLENLQFSANNLSVFINDILDFSKIEAGKLTFVNREFSPKPVFTKIYKRFGTPVKDKGLKLSFTYDERIPEVLMGDSSRMNQILSNILHQSLETTDRGMINLEVYLEEYNTRQALVRIKVSDTGRGLETNLLNKLFSEAPSNGIENDDIFKGYQRQTMGLAMAKRLTELQNGKLVIKSKINEGTQYLMSIPFKMPESEIKIHTEAMAGAVPLLDGLKILIVEDNKINQLVVAKMLNDQNIKTSTALNGIEALDAMKTEYFDLVLMDIQMPIMDGYKTTAEIRSMEDPRKKEVPIIALTASAFLSETEKAKLFGMNDHVGKPFSPEELMEKIHNCMRNSQEGGMAV